MGFNFKLQCHVPASDTLLLFGTRGRKSKTLLVGPMERWWLEGGY